MCFPKATQWPFFKFQCQEFLATCPVSFNDISFGNFIDKRKCQGIIRKLFILSFFKKWIKATLKQII